MHASLRSLIPLYINEAGWWPFDACLRRGIDRQTSTEISKNAGLADPSVGLSILPAMEDTVPLQLSDRVVDAAWTAFHGLPRKCKPQSVGSKMQWVPLAAIVVSRGTAMDSPWPLAVHSTTLGQGKELKDRTISLDGDAHFECIALAYVARRLLSMKSSITICVEQVPSASLLVP